MYNRFLIITMQQVIYVYVYLYIRDKENKGRNS